MKSRAAVLALLVLLGACGASSATSTTARPAAIPPPPPGTAADCGSASARTLAVNRRVRVYVLHNVVYGCAGARGRSFRLGRAARVFGEARAGPVAVGGDVAAYGVTRFGVDTVLASVVVRRLTDGAVVKELSATHSLGAESFQSVGSVVVRASGAVAWIGSQHSIIGGRRAIVEVHAAGAGGDRVLDSGLGIDVTSLRLHGATLSWVHGGTARHGTLR